MILNEHGILQQFGLVVYPVDYVVVIGELEEEVNNLYRPFEEKYAEAHIAPPNSTGATYRVRERATGIPCIMVWISSIRDCTSSIVAHECGHATMEIWQFIGSEVSLDNQEPFCYLLGNLVRLAIGCFYEIPGIQPPVIKQEAFQDEKVNKERNKTKTKKE